MKKIFSLVLVGLFSMVLLTNQVYANSDDDNLIDKPIMKTSDFKRPIVDTDKDNNMKTNTITLRSVGACVLSVLIPGIGQIVNNNNADKVITHGVLGFVFPPYRIWSGYDALVAREDGYWDGRI